MIVKKVTFCNKNEIYVICKAIMCSTKHNNTKVERKDLPISGR